MLLLWVPNAQQIRLLALSWQPLFGCSCFGIHRVNGTTLTVFAQVTGLVFDFAVAAFGGADLAAGLSLVLAGDAGLGVGFSVGAALAAAGAGAGVRGT